MWALSIPAQPMPQAQTALVLRKESGVNRTGFWHTGDRQIGISHCPEGCIHLVVGRASVKMTREEFLVLAKLTDTANPGDIPGGATSGV